MNCEGQKFNAWLPLIFDSKDDKGNHKLRQFTTGYGYNLENELAKHPSERIWWHQLSKESSKIQDPPSQHFQDESAYERCSN